jgi:hypothetical protein
VSKSLTLHILLYNVDCTIYIAELFFFFKERGGKRTVMWNGAFPPYPHKPVLVRIGLFPHSGAFVLYVYILLYVYITSYCN